LDWRTGSDVKQSQLSFGTDRLKAVKALSEERAGDYKKCIDAWKSKHSVLQKRSGADKLIATTKCAVRETVWKDQVKSVTLEHKDCRKESKLLNNQLRKRDKDLAKISDLLVISQCRLSEANSSLTQVIGERESYKKLQKTFEPEATRLQSKVDGQAKQKRGPHSKEMSLLAVQKLQLALETQREKKEAMKEKLQHAHKEKKSLIKYTAQICGEEKAKDLAAKDLIRKEKLDKATSRLSMAASAMNHQNYALLGGTFPPPSRTQSHVVADKSIGSVSIPA
jgi:hypothetical protein